MGQRVEGEGKMAETVRTSDGARGHRQRLKDRFVAGDLQAREDEVLLELLLCYAIPQKDVQPLARKLLRTFGGLRAVLDADIDALCAVEGIKEHSAVLLNLTGWISTHTGASS